MSEIFHVKEISLDQWNKHWQCMPKANMLQSWQYGVAKEQAEGWHALRFLISDNSGHPVALAQILIRSFFLLGGVARLNRGPLLLDELPDDQMVERVLGALRAILREALQRRWWVVQIAPELPDTDTVHKALQRLSLRRLPMPAWASGRLTLRLEEQALLMGLNGKWRNCLRKGERLGVLVTCHNGSDPELNLLINGYAELQRSKGFEGLPEALLRNLALQQGKAWQFGLFIAQAADTPASDEPIGMLVTIRHGDTTTYLIGSTNNQGRQMQANSVLLWHAILHAKQSGCVWFDIGGLNEATPRGVAEFKKGINAAPYTLVGEWRWYYRPWRMLEYK
jgi:lipid II:glycine glycyltransferase (peptidoglycan interpeptide bridge formation enzyme)